MADRAILETALRLLMEQGYDAMSIEGVAAAAGVGKPTIYRRYASKRELVVAAISSLSDTLALPPDSGDGRAELFAYLSEMLGILQSNSGFAVLGAMLVKEREDPGLLALLRRQVIEARMAAVAGLLRRGIARGEVRADIPLDATAEMLAGAIFARHIAGQAEDPAWLHSIIDTLWWGLAVR